MKRPYHIVFVIGSDPSADCRVADQSSYEWALKRNIYARKWPQSWSEFRRRMEEGQTLCGLPREFEAVCDYEATLGNDICENCAALLWKEFHADVFRLGDRVFIEDTVAQAKSLRLAGTIVQGPTVDGLYDVCLDLGGNIIRHIGTLRRMCGGSMESNPHRTSA